MLVSFYKDGSYGVPQDKARAIELMLEAGELGCANGYYNLGVCYRLGDGVEIDKKKAKDYFYFTHLSSDVKI